MDTALRVESRWFAKILRSPEAAAMIRTLFVSMQDLNKGARRPADDAADGVQENRRGRRRLHGRRHRAGERGGGIASRADRPRSGDGRQGQGRLAQGAQRPRCQGPHEGRRARRAARLYHAERRLRRVEGLRSGDRGGVRGSQGQVRRGRQGAGRDRRQRDLCLQHLDAADHVAGRRVQGPGALHRHPFLLAGRPHDAGRDHSRQADRRQGARRRARLRARHPQDADRGQRLARLLHLARGRHLYPRRPSDAGGRRAGGDDRECRPHGRHAGRPALAQRRGGGRSGLEDPEGHRSRSRRQGDRSAPEGAAGRDGREARPLTAARTARASTIIRRRARRNCGRAWPICKRKSSIPTRSTCRS